MKLALAKRSLMFTALLGFVITAPASAAVLNSAQLIRWNCPPNDAGAPAADAAGNRLLLRVVDTAGNNFEIRCIRTLGGFHYSYVISFPNGDEEEISQCIYSVGLNDAELIYTGPMTQTTTAGGTSPQSRRVPEK